MKTALFQAKNLHETRTIGAAVASAIPPDRGVLIALDGPLGAGKTHLVQAIAEAMGVPQQSVTSPTFVLINEYAGKTGTGPPRMIYHFDAYRVADDDEFLGLGPEEYFQSNGICLIEWASRVQCCLPEELLRIEISVIDERTRRLEFSASGDLHERLLEDVARMLQSNGDDAR